MQSAGKAAVSVFIGFYRSLSGILLRGQCRYIPSCSQYAIDAVGKYSLPKALAKIGYRLLRCNPLHAGGYDPA